MFNRVTDVSAKCALASYRQLDKKLKLIFLLILQRARYVGLKTGQTDSELSLKGTPSRIDLLNQRIW